MTESEFNTELAALNVELMACTTREEHSLVDHKINVLVDSYRTPVNNTEALEAHHELYASFG